MSHPIKNPGQTKKKFKPSTYKLRACYSNKLTQSIKDETSIRTWIGPNEATLNSALKADGSCTEQSVSLWDKTWTDAALCSAKAKKKNFQIRGKERTIFESFYKSAIPASILTRMNQIERIYKKKIMGKIAKVFGLVIQTHTPLNRK